MRMCSETTKQEIAGFRVTVHDPQWLRSAHWNAMHGYPMSRKTENRMRVALGLAPLPALVEVYPCEDCGDVHTGRCNGKPVAAVVTLAPGETARITNGTKYKRKRKKDWAVRLPLDLRAECEAQGVKPTSAIVAHAMRDYLALQRLYRRREDDEAALVEATARRQSDGG